QSRFFQFRVGESPTNVQENYQLLLEKAFSGANRNPLKRPAINNAWGSFQVAGPELVDTQLDNSPGFASMFPERTAVGGNLPFNTYFSLGNGENYFYKGKVTHGAWYNMSQQDIVPTYRWLVTAKGDMTTYANDIDVRFTHEDAYIGGSSIRLSGATSNGNDIVLYRTNLTVGAGSPMATLALKSGKTGTNASCLSVIIRKKGSDNWIEVPCGDLTGNTWNVKELPVAGLASGDVVEYIGLRVNGSDAGYKMLVGQLKLSDGVCSGDFAKIEKNSLKVEIKEETPLSLSVKMTWSPDYTGFTTSYNEYGNVYNDEINVDHFEIVYKESADGAVKEIGRTSQWATYIGNIPMDQSTNAYIGVRSVSTDLKCCSPIEWVEIPRYTGELPEVEEEDPYGQSWMSSIGNGTLENCVKYIYTEKVTTTGATQDLNYVVTSNPLQGNSTEQYYFAKDHKLILTQGQKITMLFKGFNSGTSESLQYDFVNAYIDYDGNYSFLDADETIGKFGTLNAGTPAIVNPGLTIEFTVPEDAHIGESRLRIVGSDAWTPHPGPTGGTVKGYSIDFPVEIQGTNPDRGPAETYKDLRDQGEPEQPEDIDGFSGISEVAGSSAVSGVEVVGNTAYFTNVEKAWFFDVAGRMVKFVNDGAESVSIADFANGVYVVKMEYNNVIRSQKVVKK
ncbi:MAG: T9SS type A sorting domain-containing protein, partial [Muribaculaceae bacterium]|nr:T9SS type A sorting domain-containing protein [Muribaculaceae bacterium]